VDVQHEALLEQFKAEDEEDERNMALAQTLHQQEADDLIASEEARVAQEARMQAMKEADERLALELSEQWAQEQERCDEDARIAAGLAQEIFECSICMEDRSEEDVFLVDRCEHKLCRFCMAQHVLSEVTAARVPARCPICMIDSPDDVKELSEAAAMTVLEPDQTTLYQKISLQNAVEQNKHMHHCNEPNCNGVVELVDDFKRFSCPIPECGVERCISCNVPWHKDQTCEQYQQWQADNEAGDDRMADLVGAGAISVCNRCGNGVYKHAGCNHMTCRCGAHFCYLCKADLGTTNHYEHFNTGPCQLFTGPEYEGD
jgi:hypothetical protein